MEKMSQRLAKKSVNAILAALEIYNKPDCKYREESFCILMINGFELLFKAKILSDNSEKINSLYVYENKKGKKDKILKQKIIKRNRTYTIDINRCMNLLLSQGGITNNIKENIDILIEIRDNAIHLLNNSNNLKQKIYSICVASIKNYVKLFENWFPKVGIQNYNFFITPLNFDIALKNYDTVNLSVAENNFINYIELASNLASENDEFDILLNVDLKISRNNINEALLIEYANNGKKINVELNDETFKKCTHLHISSLLK